MYTIGKLSKNTGVTVRTLDYYDEIDLIKPSSKTNGGHRLYTEDDVMRLERVLALKYMGFSLEQIKDILVHSTAKWQDSIQEQLELVKNEQERLKQLEQALLSISYSIELEGEVNWSVIFRTIQLFQKKPEEAFAQYKDYLSMEEMKKVMDMNAANMSETEIKAWFKVINDIKNNLDLDPESDKAIQLVKNWANQADEMFGNDEQLLGNVWEALQNLQEGIAFYPMDHRVIDFIKRVALAQKGE